MPARREPPRRVTSPIVSAPTNPSAAPPTCGWPRWRRPSRPIPTGLRIEVHPNSALGSDNDMLAAVRAGELDFYLAGNNLGPVAQVSELPTLPYIFHDNATVFRALDGELGDYIRARLADNGLHAFPYYMQNGFHQLTSNVKPIASADDLRGLTLRTPIMKMPSEFFRLFGAEPVGITFNKMYDSLRDGVVQAQTDPMGIVVSLRLYEVQKYLSMTNHWWSGFLLVANPGSWNRLPADLRDVVNRNQQKYALLHRQDVDAVNDAGIGTLTGKGMLVNDVDTASFTARLGGFYDTWRGIYGQDVWNILRRFTNAVT
ncbi:TRAP transporter substrate-binding protein [Mycolicibacterium sp.]|uniref:TRAP transporter substrate-binding protein n=1 Tax=Mycolicibacterium sp. TaxID=2320850 RepID=UPI003D0EDB23